MLSLCLTRGKSGKLAIICTQILNWKKTLAGWAVYLIFDLFALPITTTNQLFIKINIDNKSEIG